MNDVDPRLVRALGEQLARRPADAARVGWKAGGGERERIGGELAVGSLTSTTALADGAVCAAGGLELYADVEGTVTIGLVANAPVASGDEVVAEIGSLGRVSLRIA